MSARETHNQGPGNRPGPIAGWLIFAAGVAMLLSAVLIPAQDDLAEARWRRDQALALETHALDRIDRHERYLAAIDKGDPAVLTSLAGAQLGLIPAGQTALIAPGRPPDVDLFGAIEPPPPTMRDRPRIGSTLERITTDPHLRLWVIAGSTVAILIGLLPPARAARAGS
ncbi:MAG: hypothetical protein R3B49_00445 [Phycisphaerales bacterium]